MTAQVIAGVDGSDESLAAVEWAAEEARVRQVPLALVHIEELPANPEIPLAQLTEAAERAEGLLRATADRLRAEHAGMEVSVAQSKGRAAEELTAAANTADLTVLGSRGLGRMTGFLAGSVSLAVVGAALNPVVLVRAQDERIAAPGGMLVGVDVDRAPDALFAFAFEEAARRNLDLRFLHSWTLPASYGYAALMDPALGVDQSEHLTRTLLDLMEPWHRRYPEVEATAKAVVGSPALQMVEASRDAELVVVGRRSRRLPLGPHLGHVAQAVIHHSPAPVVIVPLT
ncbi:universal stress protein [Streptomyces sp. SID9727]|uniref:universal stress protein n=1 Tax=Streptomyces sp. SID9727 TaxID=2706114 RepID=UPI0013CDC716|nr:universal stress protein [Streptomyces sp. SID9727]NEC67711.1 universal stress protein [Streptomyces sp. SID9727]